MQDEFLSPGDAAKLLGVSRQRLTQLREKGQVEAHRLGRFWVYPRASLEQRKAEVERLRPKHRAGTLAAASPALAIPR